jgi:hypothetical protein
LPSRLLSAVPTLVHIAESARWAELGRKGMAFLIRSDANVQLISSIKGPGRRPGATSQDTRGAAQLRHHLGELFGAICRLSIPGEPVL